MQTGVVQWGPKGAMTTSSSVAFIGPDPIPISSPLHLDNPFVSLTPEMKKVAGSKWKIAGIPS
jgi:hypothetical protein